MRDDAFEHHRSVWTRLGHDDPLWAVLTDPAKRGGGWALDEFMATGEEHVERLESQLSTWGLSLRNRRVLDFGCGVGRLTQALARIADSVVGVDISESMIENAERFNRFPASCRYVHNPCPDLGLFADASFDAIVSFIALQHVPPPAGQSYVEEFARLAAPGGLLCFQVPSHLADNALPEDCMRAELQLLDAPDRVARGSGFSVKVRVANASRCAWSGAGQQELRVGNHWCTPSGEIIERDDGRVRVDALDPGDHLIVDLECIAPHRAGRYLLTVDVVQEGRAWFGDVGSKCASRELRVVRRWWRRPPPRHVSVEDTFGMFPIARADVERLLRKAGMEILDVAESDVEAGPGWVSYTYIARRLA